MNWLLPRFENAQPPRAAEAQSRVKAEPAWPDPYRGEPLGVECAWPVSIHDGTRRTPT